MVLNKCKCKVFDSSTKRTRLCKNNVFFRQSCRIHTNMTFKHISRIQSVIRGFLIRKKLKYFNILPRDLQLKIIYNMREDFYNHKYNSSISKLIYSKSKKFVIDKKLDFLINIANPNLWYNSDNNLDNSLSEIENLFYLFSKYNMILNNDDIYEIDKYVKMAHNLMVCKKIINCETFINHERKFLINFNKFNQEYIRRCFIYNN